MAKDAVAEIMAPGPCRRRAVGEIVKTRAIAAEPADRDAERQRQRKTGAGSDRDPCGPFVELDRQDAADQRSFHGARDAALARQPQIGGAEQIGAEPRAEHQSGEVGPLKGLRRKPQALSRQPVERHGRSQPRRDVEESVKESPAHAGTLAQVPPRRDSAAASYPPRGASQAASRPASPRSDRRRAAPPRSAS